LKVAPLTLRVVVFGNDEAGMSDHLGFVLQLGDQGRHVGHLEPARAWAAR
jgi:hypothetical protein